MNCDNCSACCENITLPLAMIPSEDVKQWIELHGIKVNGQEITIGQPCRELINGRCNIYEQRPDNCKLYFCKQYEDHPSSSN